MTRIRCSRVFLCAALLAFTVGAADPVKLDGTVVQGALLIGHAEPGSKVWHDGRRMPVAPDGRFLIGIPYNAPPFTEIKVESPKGEMGATSLLVAARRYEIEKIDNLPPSQVTPDAETLKRISTERVELEHALTARTTTPMFDRPFRWPVTGIVTGVYGSTRVLNGEPRSPHLGVDVTAAEGTPIVAPTEGVVALVADYFFTGNTVVIDHGYGLTSLYAHLSRVDVKPGDRVAQGGVIGLMGATGRATGPNLHWGVDLSGVALDPALLAGPMPKAKEPGSGDSGGPEKTQ